MAADFSKTPLGSTILSAIPTTPIAPSTMKFMPFIGQREITQGAIEFQIPPKEISEDKQARYNPQQIFGRFEPVRMYSGSDPTQIRFQLEYYWLEDSFTASIGSWDGINRNVKKLKAFLYPAKTGPKLTNNMSTANSEIMGDNSAGVGMSDQGSSNIGRLSPPPYLRFWYGDVFRGFPCILTGCNIKYAGPWNDAGLAAVARRIADNTASKFGGKIGDIASLVSKGAGLANSAVNFINNALGAQRYDKVFPFVTTIDISLESNWPLDTFLTYQDVAGVDEEDTTPGNFVGKLVKNFVGGTEARNFTNASINFLGDLKDSFIGRGL